MQRRNGKQLVHEKWSMKRNPIQLNSIKFNQSEAIKHSKSANVHKLAIKVVQFN